MKIIIIVMLDSYYLTEYYAQNATDGLLIFTLRRKLILNINILGCSHLLHRDSTAGPEQSAVMSRCSRCAVA